MINAPGGTGPSAAAGGPRRPHFRWLDNRPSENRRPRFRVAAFSQPVYGACENLATGGVVIPDPIWNLASPPKKLGIAVGGVIGMEITMFTHPRMDTDMETRESPGRPHGIRNLP
jgi:hypothetical protein